MEILQKGNLLEEFNEVEEVVLLDYSWLIYRYYYVHGEMSNGAGVFNGIHFGISTLVKYFLRGGKKRLLVFCKDGYPEEKYKLFEDYKKRRRIECEEDHVDVFSLVEDLEEIVCIVPNVLFTYDKKREADDLLAHWAYFFKALGKHTVVFSGDNDLLQLLPQGIFISRGFKNSRHEYVGEDYVFKKFGIPSVYLLMYRTIIGDPSDDIPPIFPRLRRAFIRDFVKFWHGNSIQEAFDMFQPLNPKIVAIIREKLPEIKRNYELMKLFPLQNQDFLIYRNPGTRKLVLKYGLRSFDKFLTEEL